MARPNLSYLKYLLLAVFGVPCGILTGLTGLSCAPILQPSLRWLVGWKGPVLSGAVLLLVSFSALSGVFSFGQSGSLLVGSSVLIAIGSFLGASTAGATVRKNVEFFVKARSFWIVLPLVFSCLMVARSLGLIGHRANSELLPEYGPLLQLLWSIVIGFVVGFVGLVGDLGSLMTVPLLLLVLGRTIWQAEASALFVLLLASLPTALVHTLRRTVDFNGALALTGGGILGALFGSHEAVQLDRQTSGSLLQFICGVTLAIFALLSLFQSPVKDETTSSKVRESSDK